ncbi:hypothetical protein D3C71_1356850 [compost metagenome]
MGAGALLLGGAGRVMRRVMDHAQHTDRVIEASVEEIALNPQRNGHCPQQRLCEGLHVDVVLLHQRFPTGQGRMAIGAAQGFFRQYVRVVGRQVQAHVESFLEVAGFARVQLFGGDGAVASMMTALGDVDLEFFGSGLGEEASGVVEQGVDARGTDWMALDVEETPLAAGVVDVCGHGWPGVLVVAVERGDVDDGEAGHAQSLKAMNFQCGSGLAREKAGTSNISVV